MSTLTTRLGLYKPAADGSELVSVVTDLNNNMDSIDAKMGAFACTSGARPASPYNGQFIRETDTGKMYCCTNTVGPVWTQVLFDSAAFDADLTLSSSNKLRLTNVADVGLATTAHAFQIGLDSGQNFRADGNEIMSVNNGVASTLHINPDGGDVTLNNNISPANAFTVKMNTSITGTLSVAGATTVDDLTLSGDLNLGSARYRDQLSTAGTVVNTAAETAIGTFNIPASDAVVGAIYRIHIAALASVSGTPTLTLRGRIGGVAGAAITATGIVITAASNGTNHHWFADLDYVIVSTGAGGTGRGFLKAAEAMSLGGASPFTGLVTKCDGGLATVAHDTTASKDLVITVQWSAASVSNTTTAYVVTCERVA